jgi:glycosyltransferase involved in cell wall biosynthesis
MSKPYRIGLVMQGDRNWMGGVEYIKNIVFALSTLPDEVKRKIEICLICDRSMDKSLYESIVPHLHEVFYMEEPNRLKELFRKIKRVALGQPLFGVRIATFLSYNPNHRLNFIYPYTPYSTGNNNGISTASWIADFQHKYFPSLFNSRSLFLRNKSFDHIAHNASTVVVSSQSAKSDFHKFFPTSKSKVKILSFTTFPLNEWYSSDPEEIITVYSLPRKYFLVSNQFWKHKNHELVFKAMAILKSININIAVVFTGKLGDERDKSFASEIRKTIVDFDLEKQVYLLGLVPKNDQVQIMRYAIAMIQPSLFEGWSTAVEDARSLRKKIALSDIPVHLEQSPPNALFFGKNNPHELATILKEWWESTEPGVDFHQEAIGKENALEQIRCIAYTFLDIADVSAQRE